MLNGDNGRNGYRSKWMSNEFEAWIELPFTIHYDFQRPEPRTRHDPGCPAAVCVNTIEFQGKELPTEILNYILKEHGDSLEEQCWDDLE